MKGLPVDFLSTGIFYPSKQTKIENLFAFYDKKAYTIGIYLLVCLIFLFNYLLVAFIKGFTYLSRHCQDI